MDGNGSVQAAVEAGNYFGHLPPAGIIPVTLGPRIFRTETAALVGPALILHALGEMG